MGVPLEKLRGLDWSPGLIADYTAAAERFPTAGSCAADPDAPIARSRIDWYRIGSDVETDVCLSRVVARLRTADAAVAWLRASGFDASVEAGATAPTRMHRSARDRDAVALSARWPLGDSGPLIRRGVLTPSLQWLLGHGVSCEILIGRPSGTVSVNCTTTILYVARSSPPGWPYATGRRLLIRS